MEKALVRVKTNPLIFWQMLAVIAVSGVVLYTVGLYQEPALHEAFHDVRHAMGFPCH